MKVSIIETGRFKLDGGAMFGIVPRSIWQRLNPPDVNNMCTWAMRCLLIETAGRKILIDTGMGDKQGAKFRSYFEPHGDDNLLLSLQKIDLNAEDITDVFLTHLHFDHVGGAVKRDSRGQLVPTFPNATYWSNQLHYDWASNPNIKEKASFLKENFMPLQQAGALRFIQLKEQDAEWLPGIEVRFVFGHTEAMMVPVIRTGDVTLVYCADVIPSSFHLGLPYVMSYDVRPLLTLKEKKRIIEDALAQGHFLFFEHDPALACAGLRRNEKGKVVAEEIDFQHLFGG